MSRDKSIYKLRQHKWAKPLKLSIFAASMAQQTACETDRIYELMLLARQGEFDLIMPARPSWEVWLGMYRDHCRVFRGAVGGMLLPGDHEQEIRGGRIRTDDFVHPKHALYQAELHPARGQYRLGRIAGVGAAGASGGVGGRGQSVAESRAALRPGVGG